MGASWGKEGIRLSFTFDGTPHNVCMPTEATVGDLRAKIEEVTGLAPTEQRVVGLWRKGKQPKDQVLLSTLRIPQGSFVVSKKGGGGGGEGGAQAQNGNGNGNGKKGKGKGKGKAAEQKMKAPKVQYQLRELKQTLEEVEGKFAKEVEETEDAVEEMETQEKVEELRAMEKEERDRVLASMVKRCGLGVEQLMRKLEGVDALNGDDDEVRRMRKEAVRKIQGLIDRLDALKDQRMVTLRSQFQEAG